MNRIFVVLIGSVVALGVMIFTLSQTDKKRSAANVGNGGAEVEPLMMFCAASNRAVMEAIRADYQAEFNREVQVNYGPSQGLLSQIEVSKAGDLYLPADDSYLKIAKEKGLIEEVLPVAKQQAVIAVKKGNPKSIKSFDDLLRDDVRVVQASPEATAIGKVSRNLLSKAKLWEKLDKATAAYRGTVTEVANDIQVGAADAGIVYDAVLHTYTDLEFVEIPELKQGASPIAVGVVGGTRQPQAALHFARYLSAIDRGLKRYTEYGFRVSGGDRWATCRS